MPEAGRTGPRRGQRASWRDRAGQGMFLALLLAGGINGAGGTTTGSVAGSASAIPAGMAPAIAQAAAPIPGASAAPPPEPLPVPLASPAGQALLRRRATLSADYPPLAQWYETQANLAYCGVASSVTLLNSLAIPAPAAEGYGSYRFWTQTNLFVPASAPFVQARQVAREGMTLSQLQGLLRAILGDGARVERYHGLQLNLEQFRLLLRRNLADPSDRLLVNYDRRLVGQQGGGHIAPLAAYDPIEDRVLILDGARYRYPAVWVATRQLWAATRGIDRSSGLSRGLVSVRINPADSGPPRFHPGGRSGR